MYICARCNCSVAEPDYVPAPPRWRRFLQSGRPVPVCPCRHSLRSRVVGDLTDRSVGYAIMRSLGLTTLFFFCAVVEDLRPRAHLHSYEHACLFGMTLLVLAIGSVALMDAWLWAGRHGPVHRLTERAFGTAIGALIPGIACLHALYFGWAGPLIKSVFRDWL